MNSSMILQLPAGVGYISWDEMQSAYPKFAKALQKRSVEHYYNYNPVTAQYMCKEHLEPKIMDLMGMDFKTVTAGDDPVAAVKPAKSLPKVYFTNIKCVSAGSVFKDAPDAGETMTIEELLETYPETAASFDGADQDSRLDYFFKRHVKNTDDGHALYVPISKERRIMFTDLLEDEIDEKLKSESA